MRALDYRLATVLALPWALGGCPGDDVTTPGDGSDASTAAESTTASTDPDTTTTDNPPQTTTGADTTTGSTGDPPPATSDSGTAGSSDTAAEEESDSTSIPAVCGDNVVEGDETCDLAQLGGETCQSLGFEGGQLGCLLTCDGYNTLGCFICGNEVVDLPEDCEGTVPEGVSCESMGFESGALRCGDDCLWDMSDCSICGDGIRQGDEQCDALDYDEQTCAGLGFDGGDLGCNLAECRFTYNNCVGGFYTEDFETGELDPAYTNDLTYPWTIDAASSISGIYSARSGDIPSGVGGAGNLTLSVNFLVEGEVSFLHAESTAAGNDFLEFYVDGLQGGQWSGETTPTTHDQTISAGMHTLQWRFSRIGFGDGGSNAVWVDNIQLSGGTIVP